MLLAVNSIEQNVEVHAMLYMCRIGIA